jgi:hypothetical protein
MTMGQIQKKQDRESRKFETAKAIRELLDQHCKALGLKGDEAAEAETEILDLVGGEDE